MKTGYSPLIFGIFLALLAFRSALAGDGTSPPDPLALVQELSREVQVLPNAPSGMQGELVVLEAAVSNLVQSLNEARRSEAVAHARMASWTATILARELKKVSASARLIEITEKTGRTEEVARYRERHEQLLKTIDETAAHYGTIVRHLGSLDPELVAYGFDQYQEYLIGKELASQLGVHRVVRRQVETFLKTGSGDLAAWQNELQSL